MYSLLCVCLGNICRSPSAEAIFKTLVTQRGLADHFFIDSAGTYGGHSGEPADHRMQRHATKRGYNLTSRSRQITENDLEKFDWIIAMDRENLRNIQRLDRTGKYAHKIVLITDYATAISTNGVPDPYYGGSEGFEQVLNILEDSCTGFLNSLVLK